jgi:predicted dehydrogenase
MRRPWFAFGFLLAIASVWAAFVRGDVLQQPAEPAKPAAGKKEPETPTLKPATQVKEFDDWVTSLAYAPNGKLLAAGTYEAVKLWNTETKKFDATLKVKSGFARAVAFSPDGSLLAGGAYQSVVLWDVATKEIRASLDGHRGYVTGVVFSPDGKMLATSSEDETARLWDVAKGAELSVLRGHSYPVQAVAFSPDGQLLATAAGDETRVTKPGEVKLWTVATGEEKLTLPEHKRAATGVAFSPDGKFLVSTSIDETANVYEIATGKALGYFGGHSRPTTCVVFAPGGNTVITGSGGRAKGMNEVKLWERETGEEQAILAGHAAKVTAVALAPDGKTLASAGQDKLLALWDVGAVLAGAKPQAAGEGEKPKELRAGIIGLDTSHVTAFTKLLNDPAVAPDLAGCKIVAAYPKGSPDIESSTSRVPEYTAEVQKHGVEIVDSIDALLEKVDVVFLETNDGRPHLEQALPCFKAGKPVFIDKPIAGSLADAVAIFEAAKEHKVPVFSSSSLRFSEGAQALRKGKIGDILGCDAYSPCSLEKTHPDLFWYGIHGVESLFTVMGPGCRSVTRTSTPDLDVVVGTWEGGRVGTFRGIRKGKSGYGGTAFGTNGIAEIGSYGGYRPLLVECVKFFRTGEPPVSEQETLEIYAFMEAADESKRQGGVPVTLESVFAKAREEAKRQATGK